MTIDAAFATGRGRLQLDVLLGAREGETVALLGPNGAGKTTCLRAIAGLQTIERGYISLDGRIVDGGPGGDFVAPEERSVGVVFQEHLLFPHLRVVDNIAFGLVSRGVKQKLARAAANTWVDRIDMAAYREAWPRELSGGQAQRVALARALAIRPRALLLDEPLAAADSAARLELRRLLRAQLRTFPGSCIVVAHDVDDAIAMSDRIAVLEDGRIVQNGTIDELGQKPSTRYVSDLVGINCFRGTCAGNVLTVANGSTVVVGQSLHGDAIATVHPRAIALFRERPAGSPRNVWRAPVRATERVLSCYRVQIGGDLPVIAEVTQSAVDELGLERGGEVWVAIKATEIKLVSA